MQSVHYTASINCCCQNVYCNDNKITEFEIIDCKNSSTYVILMNWLTYELWIEQEGRRLITPMALAHPLHRINSRSRNKHRNLWAARCVSSWWPLFPSKTVLIYDYLYVCILYTSSGYRAYICIQRGCRSILVKLHPIMVCRTVFENVRFLCWMPIVVFFSFTSCVFIYDNKTNTEMLVTIGIRLKQHFGARYFAFCNLSPTVMFCPWTFFQNIGFDMVPSDPFMSHPDTQLGYSTGEFQALQLIVIAAFGVVD